MSSYSLQKFVKYTRAQERIQCCTSCAVLSASEIILAQKGIDLHFSRLFLYYTTRKFKNRLNENGAELSDALDALKHGVPLEKYWPFTFNRVNVEPTGQSYQEAANYRLNSYKNVIGEDYKYYIRLGYPIVIGFSTGKLFWQLKGEFSEHNYKPINSINRKTNGHAVVIIGYDDNLNGGSWIILNSSGPQWGSRGFGAIPYSCNVDIGEAYVVTEFAGITPEKKISEN